MAHSKSEIKKAKNLLSKYAPKGEQLAYINPKEANLLKKMGGAGIMTKAGIRSYRSTGYSDYSSPSSSTASTSSSSRSSGGQSNNSDNNSGNDQPVSYRSVAAKTAAPKQKSILDYSLTYQAVKYVFNKVKGAFEKQRGKRGLNPNLSPSSTTANKTFNQMKSGGDYISDNGGNNTPPPINFRGRIIKLSPTTAEISQSGAADADAYDNRKTKAKGRSMMIQTSSRGINRNNTLTLGKPSLLGA
jgi:hypothetical protein